MNMDGFYKTSCLRTRTVCLSREESWRECNTLTRRNCWFEGWFMETVTEVVWSRRRRGRESDFSRGIHRFGAIMKNPWLQTAFSKLKLASTSTNINVIIRSVLPSKCVCIFITSSHQALYYTASKVSGNRKFNVYTNK